jgi:hypothetical protein
MIHAIYVGQSGQSRCTDKYPATDTKTLYIVRYSFSYSSPLRILLRITTGCWPLGCKFVNNFVRRCVCMRKSQTNLNPNRPSRFGCRTPRRFRNAGFHRTRWITKTAIICFVIAITLSARADQKLRVVVHVPANTPKTESVYLAGSLPSVGGWKADVLKLARQADGTFRSGSFRETTPVLLAPQKNSPGSSDR